MRASEYADTYAAPSAMWTAAQAENGDVVVSLRGVDQEALDAAEMREFMSRVKEPEEAPVDAIARRSTAGGILGALSAAAVAGAVAFLTLPVAYAAGVTAVVGGIAGVNAVNDERRKRRDGKALALIDWQLVLGADTFEVRCAGESRLRIPLSEIERFIGGRRMVVELRNRSTRQLPMCLPTYDHAALAHDLTERVVATRIAHGGYR